jgi:hypothetical protein
MLFSDELFTRVFNGMELDAVEPVARRPRGRHGRRHHLRR